MARKKSTCRLGERLKALRGDASSSDIAKEAGVSHVQILRYEKGVQFPKVKTLRNLAEIFEVPYTELRKLYYQDILSDPEELASVQAALQEMNSRRPD